MQTTERIVQEPIFIFDIIINRNIEGLGVDV